MPLVDTHCHLHREEFDADRDAVLGRAEAAGITALLDPATDRASNRTVVQLAERHANLYAAVGLHPHHAGELTPVVLHELATLATGPKVVAVGEIGLDYYRDLCPRDTQKETFRTMIRLAHSVNLPVIIHCREAFQDLFSILRESLTPPIRGLLHCFSGDGGAAAEAMEMGLYLSFAGNLTYPNAGLLREVAKEVPFDKVVLETDAPFLPPQPHRGRRNEPAYLPELVRTWAGIHDLTPEDVARVTTVNAYQLFGIGQPPAPGQIAYPIRKALYLNITNACTDRCLFCALSTEDFWKGRGTAPIVKGHHLRIPRDPTVDEILEAAGDPARYEEVVFCGYGEPIIRLQVLLEAARRLKQRGATWVRLNTNGHGNLIHRRSVAGDLRGLVDEVSVSLNTPTAQQYLEICRPVFGVETYGSIKEFIRECREAGMKVVATAVAMPGVDVEAVRRVAEGELGVSYRVRMYNDVG